MPLTLADIPAGTAVFADANVFVYHFAPHPVLQQACQQFLERVTLQELVGYTSAHVVSNLAHRMMTMEATDLFGWPSTGIVRRMQRHPDKMGQLTRFQEAVDEIPGFGIQVLPVTMHLVSTAAALSRPQPPIRPPQRRCARRRRDAGARAGSPGQP